MNAETCKEKNPFTARRIFMATTTEVIYQGYAAYCKSLGIEPMPAYQWCDSSIGLVPKHDGNQRAAKEQQKQAQR
jgi:hypothetical protein